MIIFGGLVNKVFDLVQEWSVIENWGYRGMSSRMVSNSRQPFCDYFDLWPDREVRHLCPEKWNFDIRDFNTFNIKLKNSNKAIDNWLQCWRRINKIKFLIFIFLSLPARRCKLGSWAEVDDDRSRSQDKILDNYKCSGPSLPWSSWKGRVLWTDIWRAPHLFWTLYASENLRQCCRTKTRTCRNRFHNNLQYQDCQNSISSLIIFCRIKFKDGSNRGFLCKI